MKTLYKVSGKNLVHYKWYELDLSKVDGFGFKLKYPHRVEIYKEIKKEEYDNIEESYYKKTKDGKYYRLKYYKEYDYEYKMDKINEFLSEYGNYIDEQVVKNMPRNNSQNTRSKYTTILEFLASYLMGYTEKKYDKEKYSYNDEWEEIITRKTPVLQADDFSKNLSKSKTKWKSSNTYRLNKLFSFDNHKNERYVEYWFDKDHIKRFQTEYHIFVKGEFDREKEYLAEWCKVDIAGCFEFDGIKYNVGDNAGYQKVEYGYDIYRNEYLMDRVLCIKQGNKLKFYNQDIFEIIVKPDYL